MNALANGLKDKVTFRERPGLDLGAWGEGNRGGRILRVEEAGWI